MSYPSFLTEEFYLDKFLCDFKNNSFSLYFKNLFELELFDPYVLHVSEWKSSVYGLLF